jgi:hypothetical protein
VHFGHGFTGKYCLTDVNSLVILTLSSSGQGENPDRWLKPTRGKIEVFPLNQRDSGADGIVRMKEDGDHLNRCNFWTQSPERRLLGLIYIWNIRIT